MPLVRVKTCACPGPFKDRYGYISCLHRCASFLGKPRPPWAPADPDGRLLLSERDAVQPLTRERVLEAIELVGAELRADFSSWIDTMQVRVGWKEGR